MDQKNKRCIIPNCGCELPSNTRLPICQHHRDKIGDIAKRGGGTVLSITSVFILAKTGKASKAMDFILNTLTRK